MEDAIVVPIEFFDQITIIVFAMVDETAERRADVALQDRHLDMRHADI